MPTADTAVKWYLTGAAVLGTHRMVELVGKAATSSWNYLRTRRARKQLETTQ